MLRRLPRPHRMQIKIMDGMTQLPILLYFTGATPLSCVHQPLRILEFGPLSTNIIRRLQLQLRMQHLPPPLPTPPILHHPQKCSIPAVLTFVKQIIIHFFILKVVWKICLDGTRKFLSSYLPSFFAFPVSFHLSLFLCFKHLSLKAINFLLKAFLSFYKFLSWLIG